MAAAASTAMVRPRWHPVAALGLFAAVLAGCSSGMQYMVVDTGRYAGYHCDDLLNEWNNVNKREVQLRALIDKASEGGGGTVVAALTYRSEYEAVLAQKKVLQKTAADKNCELTRTFSSDQTIR